MASIPARADAARPFGSALVVAVLFALALLGGLAVRHLTAPREPVPAALGTNAGAARAAAAVRRAAPTVPPTVLAPLNPDEARRSNDALPLLPGPPPAARPFVFTGTPLDRAAARTCLAAAVLYEAGDDRVGEEAVAQVVLNRLRHPAFPKTVCGVVFQGSERAEGGGGCQFTFTCDGALERTPAIGPWQRAEAIADAALSGTVDRAVGTATHYHADYVVPYWRGSLDKIARVGAHVFYRWKGFWGTPAAFIGRLQPLERLDPRIVALAGPGQVAMAADLTGLVADSDVTAAAAAPAEPPRTVAHVAGIGSGDLGSALVRLADEAAGQFVVQYEIGVPPDRYPVVAGRLCGSRKDCMVFGWTDVAQMPRALPLMPMGMRGMAFLYRRSSAAGTTRPMWNCRRFRRGDAGQCIPGTD